MTSEELRAAHSSDRQNWSTPAPDFAWVHAAFRFTVDVCAEPWNHKLPRYFSKKENGLAQPWRREVWWNNCEYAEVTAWTAYSKHEAMLGGVGVNLVKACPDTDWFISATERGMGSLLKSYFVPETRVWWTVWRHLTCGVYHHDARIKFEVPAGTRGKKGNLVVPTGAPFPSTLIIHAARKHRRLADFRPAKSLKLPGFQRPNLAWRMPE